MNFSTVFVGLLVLICTQRPDTYALNCYHCIPDEKTGEDCVRVRRDQVRRCFYNQDVCMVTVTTRPQEQPIVRRGCTVSDNYPGNEASFLRHGVPRCMKYPPNDQLHVRNTCFCNDYECNGLSIGRFLSGRGYGTWSP